MDTHLRRGIAFVLMLAVFGAAGSGSADEPSTIRVSGEATASAPPDLVTLTFSVISEHKSSQSAVAKNARDSQAVLAALRTLLGDDADLRTQGFSLQPQYDRGKPNSAPTLRAYRASNTVALRLEQLDRIGAAIDAAAEAGANQVQSLVFGLRDDSALRMETLAEATRRARAKADVVAGALGSEVRRVVSLEEGGSMVYPPHPQRMRAAFEAAPTPIEAGDVEVSAQVVLVVAID